MEPTLSSTLYQFGFGISAGLAVTGAGAWLSWPSSVIKVLKEGSESITLTGGEVSTMVALMDLGNILSPIPSSYLMDCIGRKYTLILSGISCLIASISVLFATEAWMIYLARIAAGISKGISFSVIPIYLAEVASTKIRGALSTMFIGFLNIGMVYDYVIGPNLGYFYLNIANLLIPLAFLLSIVWFPESPYYLVMKGKTTAAKTSLSSYRMVNEEKSAELDKEIAQITNKVEEDMKNKARFVDLVTTACNRRALLIITLLAFFQRSTGVSPIIAYSTTIMPEHGGGLPPSSYMVFFSIVHVFATYTATPLVDTIGRKPLLMISSISTALVTGIIGLYYFLARHSSADVTHSISWIPYAGVILFAISYAIGLGFIPSTLVGELFPTNVKSYAGSVSAITLAIVSFIINKIFQAVDDQWGAYVMFWYFSLSSICCAIFVYVYVFETKGKSLKEIQDYMLNLEPEGKC